MNSFVSWVARTVGQKSLAQLVQCSSVVEDQVVPMFAKAPTHFWRPTTSAATEPERQIKAET
jgi:hypothetical protein